MNHSINQKFTASSLLKFAMPSIIMMVFMSCYTIIDGIFISRFIGSNALSSLNIVYPVFNIVIAIATMLATGGNAIVSKYLGEGKDKKARESMTMFIVLGIALSMITLIITNLFLTPICHLLGASEILLADCQTYLKVLMLFAPACMLQTLFQSYFVTAGQPKLGLILTIVAGIINAILDYLFIVPFQMGIAGAALATGLGQSIPAIAGLLFFSLSRKQIYFTRFTIDWREIRNACYNGSSEMITQFSNAVITFLFNIILMRLVGEQGIAAITILIYGQFLFNAFYMGFSIGISPVIGFQYGAGNKPQLKNIYRISMLFVMISSVFLTILSIVASNSIVSIFTKEPVTFALASSGFRIFAINFLFSGINIISSGIFTSFSNGLVSAIISFARTLVFILINLFILPRIFGIYGVWLAIPVAEFMTLLLCGKMHLKYFLKKGEANYIQ